MAKSPPPRKPPVVVKRQVKELIADPDTLGPMVLTLGSGVWKAVSVLANVDFLLSIREERVVAMFEFFESIGWWIIALIGIVWYIVRWNPKSGAPKKASPNWPLLFSSALMAFLFGVLLTARFSGSTPNVVTGYGADPPWCVATLNPRRIQIFQDIFRIGIVCGIEDPTIDPLTDDRITVSNLITIPTHGTTIAAPYSSKMKEFYVQRVARANVQNEKKITLWTRAILLPKDLNRDKVSNLSDVISLHGKLLGAPDD
jgi:hypothetical protein